MSGSNDFVPSLRIPIKSCPEQVYISGFPGKEQTLRICFPSKFPRRRFLPLSIFRLALSHAPGTIDRGRVRTTSSIDCDGITLAIDIDPREGEDVEPFSIVLSPKMVKEIDAAFRIAEVLQDHYERFSTDDAPPYANDRPTVHAPSQDGSLFFDDETA